MKSTAQYPIFFRNTQGIHPLSETLARENKLFLKVEGYDSSLISCSPGQERHLVLGRLRAAKLISDAKQIQQMDITHTNGDSLAVHVVLNREGVPEQESKAQKIQLQGTVVFECMRRLEEEQILFSQTGCTHGAALFDGQGRLLGLAEDVARRSALEKAIGQSLEEKTLSRAVLAGITSRLNVDLVACAGAAGLTFLCGISVATFAAVGEAEKYGMTLLGRVRGQGMNIYTGHERLVWDEKA